MNTSQNTPSISCLVHSGQVAKQHFLFCMIAVRGGCSVICLTSRLETRWYQRISRILLRHHWSSASIFLTSALDRAQHSDPSSKDNNKPFKMLTAGWHLVLSHNGTDKPKVHYTCFPITLPLTGKLPTCCRLVTDLLATRPTSPQQIAVMELGTDMTRQTQRTFAHTNLLQTCYGLVVYVVDLLRGSRQLVTNLLRGNWCNGFWPVLC